MRYWKKMSRAEQEKRITNALASTIDYKQNISLGIPASALDHLVFDDNAAFLKDAPLLRTYVQNPNHIGCHTLGNSEIFFKGTQDIEREVIELLSVDIMKAQPNTCDGYIASGGTEANLQAAWIYRNLFISEYAAKHKEIALISSIDAHYSITKAANLLNLEWLRISVNDQTRKIDAAQLEQVILNANAKGIKYFIIIANMGTTMFGSVDDPEVYVDVLKRHNIKFMIHVDGAFGGFIYPMSHPQSALSFSNPHISSITLDAHKMLQAPYGTGIFIIRKGFMNYVCTKEAQYVNGMDITISGSRSGTNAVAIWMILMTYGPYGWVEKINKLLYRTDWLCKKLDELGIEYFRYPKMNIVAIRSHHLQPSLTLKFGLVPDTHTDHREWYKIVVMDHVDIEHLENFLSECKQAVVG